MNWKCATCGGNSKTNRKNCPKCGSRKWKPSLPNDASELAGPAKQVTPRGLLLAHPGKQSPTQSSNIECGKCHAVIYRPDKNFDNSRLQNAMEDHYLISPSCAGKGNHRRRRT